MTTIASNPSASTTAAEHRSAYAWVMVFMAALAMAATMPGRTMGLGLITERLKKDPQFGMLDAHQYGQLNMWVTLLGALFCLGFGRLIDRVGSRLVLTIVLLSLGVVVVAMTQVSGYWWLFILLTLTRGFGQSALSVASITLVGKWFPKRRLANAMGVYSILVSICFIAVFRTAQAFPQTAPWRPFWSVIGWCLIGLAVVFWLLVRDGMAVSEQPELAAPSSERDFTLKEALSTPAFWAFGIAASIYGLISSGISLFNESIFVERGFSSEDFKSVSMITLGVGMLSNLGCGWLARRFSLSGVMGFAMGLMTVSLLALPSLRTWPHVISYGIAMGIAGGAVTVVFFLAWGKLYGPTHLGQIQGVAQMLTVLASAVGPELLGWCKVRTGSYTLIFYLFSAVCACLTLMVLLAPMPRRSKLETTPRQL